MTKWKDLPPAKNPEDPLVPPPTNLIEQTRRRIAEKARAEEEARRQKRAETQQAHERRLQAEAELVEHHNVSPAPMDALQHAAADGYIRAHWTTDDQHLVRRHQTPGARLRSEIQVLPDEQEIGIGIVDLERLTDAQDADCIFALMTVAYTLVQSYGARGWFDLDKLMQQIGWQSRSRKERDQNRARIFSYLRFGIRTRIVETGSSYVDRHTRKQISTRLETPLLMQGSVQRPDQMSLLPIEEVPVKVELALPDVWIPILEAPRMQQYFRCLQLLPAIPGGQPSGAWARCIGLVLAFNWRYEQPIPTTRRDLLFTFTPKIQPPGKLLASDNPGRTKTYWRQALSQLERNGIILKPSSEDEENDWSDRCAREKWLDTRIEIPRGRHVPL